MATETVIAWLRRDPANPNFMDGEVPGGICPVLGRAVYDWHDWLGSAEARAKLSEALAPALSVSADSSLVPARREALATWLRDVALPAFSAYANLRTGEDLDDTFAELAALNQGNGVASVNAYLGASGVTPSANAAAGIILGRTRNRDEYLRRQALGMPKVEMARRDGATEMVSPLKLQSRCFRLAFCQSADPTRTVEDLQASFFALLQGLLPSVR